MSSGRLDLEFSAPYVRCDLDCDLATFGSDLVETGDLDKLQEMPAYSDKRAGLCCILDLTAWRLLGGDRSITL